MGTGDKGYQAAIERQAQATEIAQATSQHGPWLEVTFMIARNGDFGGIGGTTERSTGARAFRRRSQHRVRHPGLPQSGRPGPPTGTHAFPGVPGQQ